MSNTAQNETIPAISKSEVIKESSQIKDTIFFFNIALRQS